MKGGASCVRVVRSVFTANCDRFTRPSLPEVNVFLDFENAAPSEAEFQLFSITEEVLEQAEILLSDISSYGVGASAEIRVAILQPDDRNVQSRVLNVLEKLVQRIRAYYELSIKIEQIFPLLLWELCSGPLPPAEQIDSLQATCRQFARLIDFVLLFDTLKMSTPALQNDFSFYRRSMLRKMGDGPYSVSLELANTISFFLANPTPMLTAITSASSNFVTFHADLPLTNTTATLATIVQVCRFMVENEENWVRLSEYRRLFTVRLMVGAIILFDHVDHAGAFCKDSLIDIKSVVELLKTEFKPDVAESLLNILRFNTKHLSDATTPKSVRLLFA